MMLAIGIFPFIIESILEKSSTAARMRANISIVTNAIFRIEKMTYLVSIFIVPS